MFTILNWLTTLPDTVGAMLFWGATILGSALPTGVGWWRDRHGALPRRRKASWWAASLGAAGAFGMAFIFIGCLVAPLLWAWVHSDNFHGHTDDMAAGTFLSLVLPPSCLAAASVRRGLRWRRGSAVSNEAAPAELRAAPSGGPTEPPANSSLSGGPPSVS